MEKACYTKVQYQLSEDELTSAIITSFKVPSPDASA